MFRRTHQATLPPISQPLVNTGQCSAKLIKLPSLRYLNLWLTQVSALPNSSSYPPSDISTSGQHRSVLRQTHQATLPPISQPLVNTGKCSAKLIKLPSLRYLNLWSTQVSAPPNSSSYPPSDISTSGQHRSVLRQTHQATLPPISQPLVNTGQCSAKLIKLPSLRYLNLWSTQVSAPPNSSSYPPSDISTSGQHRSVLRQTHQATLPLISQPLVNTGKCSAKLIKLPSLRYLNLWSTQVSAPPNSSSYPPSDISTSGQHR